MAGRDWVEIRDRTGRVHAVGRWFPLGTPVSSTRKLISSSSFDRLDMTLAVAEALNPNKPKQTNQLVRVELVTI